MKPIQILCGKDGALLALREDGSIWEFLIYESYWKKLPEVREPTNEEVQQAVARIENFTETVGRALGGS